MENQSQNRTAEFEPARFFESFIAVARELLLRPRAFFNGLPRHTGIANPFIFLAACAFLASLFMANVRSGDYNLFLTLLFANTASAFVGSFMLNGIVSKFFGSHAPFGATFRILAYASLMDIVSWIPLVGPIAYFYGLYLIFVGLQEIHQLKPRQAGAAVISIVVIITLLLVTLLVLAPEGVQEGIRLVNPENEAF